MADSTAIQLPKIPKDKDYEDYLCAYLQAGGLYIERCIIHREVEELLELDILTTDFQQNSAVNNLIEIKGGDWGFSDVFKIRGWLTYLNFEQGTFIVQKTRPSITFFQKKAKELSINLIDNSNLNNTLDTLKPFFLISPEDPEIQAIRFSYLLERKQLQQIKTLKKQNLGVVAYSKLDDYYFQVNSGSFFSRDPIRRINQLFDAFIKNKNLTARLGNVLEGGDFHDDSITQLSRKCYKETFFELKNSILQASLYVEHIARITILKCAIEHLIDKLKGNYNNQEIDQALDYLILPNTIKRGLSEIIKDDYFFLYPRFWQFFTYVLGGFILSDLKAQEYDLISQKTGIPINEIPNAFDAFNKLFPRNGGWFSKKPNAQIEQHLFFPCAFSGIGVNYRRLVYTKEEKSYSSLFKMLTQDKTAVDLSNWNNFAYNILK